MGATTILSTQLPETARTSGERDSRYTLEMLERALIEQQDLSAVERFSHLHDQGLPHQLDARYEALLPATAPGPGQQYAFEVDLDLCTGCKACVVACHSQNGLDEGESFRSVGLLHGGTEVKPFQQTVTTACHHCLDPACMHGCPVLAYEKDEQTGIVHHLDDQCIGCQYCVLTCPYEVPRFNASLGIVRKCDMCRGRLAEGDAPACVQGCPNGAIAIRIVDVARAADAAEVTTLVPGAPASSTTRPTTSFLAREPIPANALPADYHAVRPAADHAPLVVMLVLTQLSVGAFAMEQLLRDGLEDAARAAFASAHAPFALAVGLFSLAASVAHLGRPLGAFRAVLGLRRSWLSREIVAFGAFASAAVALAALSHPSVRDLAGTQLAPDAPLGRFADLWLGRAVVGLGLLGVFCSTMLYHVTHRAFWHVSLSGPRFLGTTAVLGVASTLTTLTTVGYVSDTAALARTASALLPWLVLATAAKVAFELSLLAHLRDRTQTELRRTATLLVGPLSDLLMARVALAVLGALVIPSLFLGDGVPTAASVVGSVCSLVVLVIGEMLERSSFFRAQRGPRMPGGLA